MPEEYPDENNASDDRTNIDETDEKEDVENPQHSKVQMMLHAIQNFFNNVPTKWPSNKHKHEKNKVVGQNNTVMSRNARNSPQKDLSIGKENEKTQRNASCRHRCCNMHQLKVNEKLEQSVNDSFKKLQLDDVELENNANDKNKDNEDNNVEVSLEDEKGMESSTKKPEKSNIVTIREVKKNLKPGCSENQLLEISRKEMHRRHSEHPIQRISFCNEGTSVRPSREILSLELNRHSERSVRTEQMPGNQLLEISRKEIQRRHSEHPIQRISSSNEGTSVRPSSENLSLELNRDSERGVKTDQMPGNQLLDISRKEIQRRHSEDPFQRISSSNESTSVRPSSENFSLELNRHSDRSVRAEQMPGNQLLEISRKEMRRRHSEQPIQRISSSNEGTSVRPSSENLSLELNRHSERSVRTEQMPGNQLLEISRKEIQRRHSEHPIQRISSSIESTSVRPSSENFSLELDRHSERSVRTEQMSHLRPGSVILLSETDMNAKLTEFKPDVCVTFNQLSKFESNPGLMSGGQVVFQDFADIFMIPDYYADDPIIFDETSNDIHINEESSLKYPNIDIFVIENLFSGAKVTGDFSKRLILPDLFPLNPDTLDWLPSLSDDETSKSFSFGSESSLDFLSNTLAAREISSSNSDLDDVFVNGPSDNDVASMSTDGAQNETGEDATDFPRLHR